MIVLVDNTPHLKTDPFFIGSSPNFSPCLIEICEVVFASCDKHERKYNLFGDGN